MKMIKFGIKITLYLVLFVLLGQIKWNARTLENHFHSWVNSRAFQRPLRTFTSLPVWSKISLASNEALDSSVDWFSKLWQDSSSRILKGLTENDTVEAISKTAIRNKQDFANSLKKYDEIGLSEGTSKILEETITKTKQMTSDAK